MYEHIGLMEYTKSPVACYWLMEGAKISKRSLQGLTECLKGKGWSTPISCHLSCVLESRRSRAFSTSRRSITFSANALRARCLHEFLRVFIWIIRPFVKFAFRN